MNIEDTVNQEKRTKTGHLTWIRLCISRTGGELAATSASEYLVATGWCPTFSGCKRLSGFGQFFWGRGGGTSWEGEGGTSAIRCLRDWKLMSPPTKLRQKHCWQPSQMFTILPVPRIDNYWAHPQKFVQWWNWIEIHEYSWKWFVVVV